MLSLCQSSRPITPIDIDYEHLPCQAQYHQAFAEVGIRRIMTENYSTIIGQILKAKRDEIIQKAVWAVVIELDANPIFVIRNIAKATIHPAERRILSYRVEDFRER